MLVALATVHEVWVFACSVNGCVVAYKWATVGVRKDADLEEVGQVFHNQAQGSRWNNSVH